MPATPIPYKSSQYRDFLIVTSPALEEEEIQPYYFYFLATLAETTAFLVLESGLGCRLVVATSQAVQSKPT